MIFKDKWKLYTDYLAGQNSLYTEPLFEPIRYIMELPGKRVRALLVLMGYESFAADPSVCLPRAHAYEMFHNFTLMHDDIMDESARRRGLPTTHIAFGVNNAILSGDAMLIHAYQYLSEGLPTDRLIPILTLFNSTALDICRGQQMDMSFEQLSDVSVKDYVEMIRLKTAILLGAALQTGALEAGANSESSNQLFLYGESLGIAFQIQDDLLDLYGDTESTGKKVGGDVLRNKKTYLVTTFLEKASDADRLRYSEITNGLEGQQKIDAVKLLFQEYDLYTHTLEKINKLYGLEATLVHKRRIRPEAKEKLELLKEWLANRQK